MENIRSTTADDGLFGPVGSIVNSGFEILFSLEQICQNKDYNYRNHKEMQYFYKPLLKGAKVTFGPLSESQLTHKISCRCSSAVGGLV